MGFFQVNKSEEALKDSSGGGIINTSGIYDVIIKYAVVEVNEKQARTINFLLEHDGRSQALFQAIRLDNNDGSANFQMDLLNKLCVIAGLDSLSEPEEMEGFKYGEKAEAKTVMVIPELCDIPVTMRIQVEYSMYNDNIQENKHIRNFFRSTDMATAAEIVKGSDFGKQFAIEKEKADIVTYKEVTEEQVNAWIAGGRKKSSDTGKKPATFGSTRKFGSNK